MNLKDITKNMNLTVGLIIILSFLVLTIISTADLHILTPYNPNQLNFSQANLPPSSNHVFGTDQEGRDVFTRSLTALRIDFSIPS